METLDEKDENKSSEVNNGIKEGRLKALKGNYQKPMFSDFQIDENIKKECSDMASQPYLPGLG